MKKSSIEQLFDEIFKIPFNTPEAEDLYSEVMDLKEKYKQMHKQEMINFSLYVESRRYSTISHIDCVKDGIYFNDYYKNKN